MWFPLAFAAMLCWSTGNVLDSILLNHTKLSALSFAFLMGLCRMVFIIAIAVFIPVQTPWAPWLFVGGMTMTGGIVLYAALLKRLDASVTCSAWALESILLSMVGFLFLHESWSQAQTLGALLAIGGVFLVSFYHQHVSFVRTVGLLTLLGLAVVLDSTMLKLAVSHGTSVPATYFWSLCGNVTAMLCVFVLRKDARTELQQTLFLMPVWLYGLAFVSYALSFSAYIFYTTAVRTNALSLVSLMNNAEPFVIMGMAAMLSKVLPEHWVPRELVSRQSVGIKVISFGLVCTGLAFLAV